MPAPTNKQQKIPMDRNNVQLLDVVELILVPGICEKMNTYGHDFTKIGPNKIIDRENRRTLTEIDLMLENG